MNGTFWLQIPWFIYHNVIGMLWAMIDIVQLTVFLWEIDLKTYGNVISSHPVITTTHRPGNMTTYRPNKYAFDGQCVLADWIAHIICTVTVEGLRANFRPFFSFSGLVCLIFVCDPQIYCKTLFVIFLCYFFRRFREIGYAKKKK